MEREHEGDRLEFLDEEEGEEGAARGKPLAPWKILIVDDDDDVHDATRLVLSRVQVLGRDLQLLHARSAAETRALLARERDVAAILLDVVMEEEDAGLKLVDYIRRDLGMDEVRIILRTGQPGHAPELEAIRDYDINDYKTKTELTRHKLYTTLTTALRSYAQIQTINASRRGLALIVDACRRLTAEQGLQAFAAGVITQLAALLGLPPEGLICARCVGEEGEESGSEYQIVAAAGRYAELVCRSLSHIEEDGVREMLAEALRTRRNQGGPDGRVLFFIGASGKDMAAYVDSSRALTEADERLLELFCRNVGPYLDNIGLIERLSYRAQFEEWLHLANRSGLCGAIRAAQAQEASDFALTLLRIEACDAFQRRPGPVLVELARRLRERMRGVGVSACLAADRFAVLAPADAVSETGLVALLGAPLDLPEGAAHLSIRSLRVPLATLSAEPEAALASVEIALSRLPAG